MAPSQITEDYYMVLEVDQTAAPQLIVNSYKRLALKLHPDKNTKHDTTEAFQRLARAYETLKDESKRQAYDLIYPSITRRRPSEALGDAAQIAAIQKSKQERSEGWRTKKNAFDSSMFELQRRIRRLEQEITNLDSIFAAEAAVEAQKNSWGAWLLSSFYKKAEDSEEEKERKGRDRQERRIGKDMKERRLESNKAALKGQENLLKKAKEEVDAADRGDDEKIRVIQARIWARENWERQEKERQERERRERDRQERERQERERIAKIWKQQQEQLEKRKLEAGSLRKQQAERRAAEQKRKETSKFQKQYAYPNLPDGSTSQAYTPTCRHDGWWPKIQGRTACPECKGSWTYLLQCPDCMMKACPRCQAAVRPRIPRNAARANRTAPSLVRTPSPDFGYDYGW